MRNHDDYVRERIERDPAFDQALREADAEIELAFQLAEAREALGMSQHELAARIGISQPAVSRYERGGRTPSVTTALRFAEALGVSIVLGPDFKVRVARHEDGAVVAEATLVDTKPAVGRQRVVATASGS